MTAFALVHASGPQRSSRSPARELYDSSYFGLKAEYATVCCDEWVVVSEKHGVVPPDESLAPYDAALEDVDATARSEWVTDVAAESMRFASADGRTSRFDTAVVLASARYADFYSPLSSHLRSVDVEVRLPLVELGGVASQQGWLREQIDRRNGP